MKEVNYSDIDFSKLKRLDNIEGKMAKLYTEKDAPKFLYKIFNDMSLQESDKKAKKLEYFSEIDELESFVNPQMSIMKNGNCKGYESGFIMNSITLDQLRHSENLTTFFNILTSVSKDLQKFHSLEGRPIIGDLHFENIIVDDAMKHYFIDVDSYGIYNIPPDNLPSTIYSYCTYWNYPAVFHQDTDKLAFMLNTFSLLFDKNFVNISVTEYEKLVDEIPYLKDLYDVYLDLKYSHSDIPDVPYFHQIVNDFDNTCIIEKSKIKTK